MIFPKTHKVEFMTEGRRPRVAPNPNYPDGVVLDFASPNGASNTCCVQLSYPAVACGIYVITCEDCKLRVAVTAASRVDDPREVILPCYFSKADITAAPNREKYAKPN